MKNILPSKVEYAGVLVIVSLLTTLQLACGAVPEHERSEGNLHTAVLAAGCFWSIEAVYDRIPGVMNVVSGYAGGELANPTDKQVASDTTGYAETVRITYDSTQISFDEILDIFWKVHDPTTPNRQGYDIGTQYRSVIFYAGDDQKQIAEYSMQQAQVMFGNRVVTELLPLHIFYTAGEYHQDYYQKRPDTRYSTLVISPKLKKMGLEE